MFHRRKIAEEKHKADEMRNALKAKEEKAQEAKETFNNLQVPRLMSEKNGRSEG